MRLVLVFVIVVSLHALGLGILSCATLEIPIDPTNTAPDAPKIIAKLVSDSDLELKWVADCPPGTTLADLPKCPIRPHIVMTSSGLEGGIIEGTLGLAGAAAAVFGAGPPPEPAVININTGSAPAAPPEP